MNQVITKDMTFDQLLQLHPTAAQILATFNLGCVGCLGASTETLAQGARAHGLDIEELLAALNKRAQ
jgi:hybrid cluster-associated redox disulfide protein